MFFGLRPHERDALAQTVRVAEGLHELGLAHEAMAELDSAVIPHSPTVLAERIKCCLALNQAAKALPVVQWLVKLLWESAPARELLALVLEDLGRSKEALRLFAGTSPKFKEPLDWFHEGRLRIFRGEMAEGRRCLELALELDPALHARINSILPWM